ncbi:DUF2975 domain-containing protein [Oceanirhabdus sp. W0125-5]|uniref:DUF2975 domain-containing protein n=1 Tax=Oceanirhabdus sp. W0125-5 TaxID=2999116 RepID=UPI0022F32D9D|nr:DUF2975 domain-containing protein [Oceanirhabdus sp. W0125-5]WBW96786.1 DUF2975 domain-containing protein [Oceanirhabdus sp. W0125-5]
MKKNPIPRILHMIVILGITLTCIVLLGAPAITTAFLKSRFSMSDGKLVITIATCIYFCAVPYVIALFKLKKLSSLVVNNNPFSMESVKSLNVISICAFIEIIIFIACTSYLKYSVEFFKNIILGGPYIVLAFLCVTIGLLCLVLSQLFEIAIKIKEENDQTI